MSSELLLEVRTDPMPPAEVEAGTQRLKNSLVGALRANGLSPKQSATGFTSRRLLVLLRGVSAQNGHSSTNRDSGDIDTETKLVGDSVVERVGACVRRAVEELSWASTMTWGEGLRWVGPIRGVLLLLDGERVPTEIFGRESVDWTVGPESAGCKRISIRNADEYGRALAELGIEIRYPERRRRLQKLLDTDARERGGELLEDAKLLKARAVSCETAGVVSVAIDAEFQALPRELIQECIRDRLAGFCVLDNSGTVLAASFVIDRWNDPDGAVARSYEWAVTTYLEDVRFFLERDRRLPLAERCREQEAQTLSPALGTYGERASRCAALCDVLCEELDWNSESDRAREAIGLLAADSRTELLRAFPGLEGVIGGLLAREEGYPASVWQAIFDSRREATDSRSLPRGRVGKLVALVDRLDRLASLLSGERGTESPDPVTSSESGRLDALLDQMIRIGIGGSMAIDLRLLGAAALRRRSQSTASEDAGEGDLELLLWRLDFLNGRIDAALFRVLQEGGFAEREISAVLKAGGSSLLSEQQVRLEGLRSLRGDPRLATIAQTAKRIAGILQGSNEQKLDVGLLAEGGEQDLYFVYRRLVDEVVDLRDQGSYAAWLQKMIDINGYADSFLRETLVRDENEHLRQNRLALLQKIHWLYAGEVRLAELLEEGE